MKKIRISIQNCSNEKMSITKEPEALVEFIDAGSTIEIQTNDEEDNILFNIGKNDDGTIYVQIWDALNTRYVIYHQGKDLFERYFK